MGLIKLTFEDANNSSKTDADINCYLDNYQHGIIYGLGENLSYTMVNGKIIFKSGYVSIYGRRLFVENNTEISVALDSTRYGYVVVEINTQTNGANIKTLEASGGYPLLTKTNLHTGTGIYQLAICGYYKTTTSLTSSWTPTYIYPNSKIISDNHSIIQEMVQSAKSTMEIGVASNRNYIDQVKGEVASKYVGTNYSSVSSNCYSYPLSSFNWQNRLIVCRMNKIATVLIPGFLLSSSYGSYGSITYHYLGVQYTFLYEKSTNDQILYLTPGSTSHKLGWIYFFG